MQSPIMTTFAIAALVVAGIVLVEVFAAVALGARKDRK